MRTCGAPTHAVIDADIAIADDELIERFVRSAGPGGQNVNKVSTAVELRRCHQLAIAAELRAACLRAATPTHRRRRTGDQCAAVSPGTESHRRARTPSPVILAATHAEKRVATRPTRVETASPRWQKSVHRSNEAVVVRRGRRRMSFASPAFRPAPRQASIRALGRTHRCGSAAGRYGDFGRTSWDPRRAAFIGVDAVGLAAKSPRNPHRSSANRNCSNLIFCCLHAHRSAKATALRPGPGALRWALEGSTARRHAQTR